MKKNVKGKGFKRWALHNNLHGFLLSTCGGEELFATRKAANDARVSQGLYMFKAVLVEVTPKVGGNGGVRV